MDATLYARPPDGRARFAARPCIAGRGGRIYPDRNPVLGRLHQSGNLSAAAGFADASRNARANCRDRDLVPEIENIVLQPGPDQDFRPMFETGALLGAERVIIGSIITDEARCVDAYAALCRSAADFGLDIAMEFYRKWAGCASLAQARRIVAAAGEPNAKLLVDCLHLIRSGGKARAMSRRRRRRRWRRFSFATQHRHPHAREWPTTDRASRIALRSRASRRRWARPPGDPSRVPRRPAPLGSKYSNRALRTRSAARLFGAMSANAGSFPHFACAGREPPRDLGGSNSLRIRMRAACARRGKS